MKVGGGGGVGRFVDGIGPVFIYFYNFVVILRNLNKCLWKSNLKIKKIGVLRDTPREPKPTMVQWNTVQYRKI